MKPWLAAEWEICGKYVTAQVGRAVTPREALPSAISVARRHAQGVQRGCGAPRFGQDRRSQGTGLAAKPPGLLHYAAAERAMGARMDSTVKTLYGHQEGAEVGYNPHKPGRPSHAYHTYMLSSLRLILKGDTRGVSARRWSPDHVPLHAQACLLDQSDRDLVLHPGSQAYPPWQLHLQRASPAEDQELHRLLQCYHGPTFPPDEKI